jgi:hypothetical protein
VQCQRCKKEERHKFAAEPHASQHSCSSLGSVLDLPQSSFTESSDRCNRLSTSGFSLHC